MWRGVEFPSPSNPSECGWYQQGCHTRYWCHQWYIGVACPTLSLAPVLVYPKWFLNVAKILPAFTALLDWNESEVYESDYNIVWRHWIPLVLPSLPGLGLLVGSPPACGLCWVSGVGPPAAVTLILSYGAPNLCYYTRLRSDGPDLLLWILRLDFLISDSKSPNVVGWLWSVFVAPLDS